MSGVRGVPPGAFPLTLSRVEERAPFFDELLADRTDSRYKRRSFRWTHRATWVGDPKPKERAMTNDRGRAAVVVGVLLTGVAAAAVNLLALAGAVQQWGAASPTSPLLVVLQDAPGRSPVPFWLLLAAPLAAALLTAVVLGLGSRAGAPPAPAAAVAPPSPPPTPAAALRLLAALQQEGRFIDFIEEEIDGYSDAQIGAAVRTIHAGCRKALHDRMKIERLRSEADGSAVEVPAGFNPAAVRLTGNVHGEPPFRGTLQHGGWRAAAVSLAAEPDPDTAILAPAEVEVE
jgi:hypothetical protein